MSDAGQGGAAADYCVDLVRTHDFARYASTLFVGSEARRGLLALYAFNVEIVRVRDVVSQPLPGEVRLQWWTDLLAGNGHGGVEGHPVASELLWAVAQFDLPREPLGRLIEAHQFDLYNDPMPTLVALEDYADATASSLFTLAAKIIGHAADPLGHAAHHAGLAQGLLQALLGLPRDAATQHQFVPDDVLARHGSSAAELFARKPAPALQAAFHEMSEEAGRHLKTAVGLLRELPPPGRRAFLPLAMVGPELVRVRRPGIDLFLPHQTSRLRTLWILWRAARSTAFGG